MDAAHDNTVGLTSTRPTYEQLLEENARLRRELESTQRQLQQARQKIHELTQLVEKLRREGKRQAAPFRKQDEPTKFPRKPGRKRGRRYGRHVRRNAPPRIDETFDVPLPAMCPHCGGNHLVETHVAQQYQTEIPRTVIYRQFNVHLGECSDCHRSVQGRHDLQTSTGCGAAASQLGPNVHALLAILNKQLGLSHGKCVKLLQTLFEGLHVARATSARSCQRTARRVQPAYRQIGELVRGASEVAPDETGWRVAGRPAWLHGFATANATYYEIDPTRSHQPAKRLLGMDWTGTLVHDGWSAYDLFKEAFHQQCVRHLQRRCQDLLAAAQGGAARFPRAVLELIDEAFALRRAWRGHQFGANELAAAGLALTLELERLASGEFTNEANRLLAGHIMNHACEWFWFLQDPQIAATNYRAEQALRMGVVNRKVWGGNRTWTGAATQSILMTVYRTCEQMLLEPFAFFNQALRSPTPLALPR